MGDRFQVVSNRAFDACFDSSGISGVLFLLVRSLLSGNISAGAFAAVFTSIDSIFRFMENIVARSAGNISRHMASVVIILSFAGRMGLRPTMARSEELLTAAVLQRKVKAAGKAVPSLWKTFLLPIPMPTDRLSIEYRFGFEGGDGCGRW